jgi:hypothetical protein
MVTEFAWATERQVLIGMRIHAEITTRLARRIAFAISDPGRRPTASLTGMDREEWMHAIRKARMRDGRPPLPGPAGPRLPSGPAVGCPGSWNARSTPGAPLTHGTGT